MGYRKRNGDFNESNYNNKSDFWHYFNRLTELWLACFRWENLPDTVDPRYLELMLLTRGKVVFFKDDVTDEYYCLQVQYGGEVDIYNMPIRRTALATNGYSCDLDNTNSVLIFDNKMHLPCEMDLKAFSRRLEKAERIIDININAQKTPILISCDENERLSMKNLYKKYDGNEPMIIGDKRLSNNPLQAISTQAPYVADKLYSLKSQIYNEALSFMGISNPQQAKRERLITPEVVQGMGGVLMSREIRLSERQKAADNINKMFGLNVKVQFAGDVLTDNALIINANETEYEVEKTDILPLTKGSE